MDTLLAREGYAYSTLWDSMSVNQRRFLTGTALENRPVEAYSSRFLARYGLGSASSAQRAAENLLARDVIDREGGGFMIVDRFLKLWIRRIGSAR